uniref:Scinderin like a n=1 Tax=Acanthochromis polyacanthus TaxID=80966 RepID=A0A3Q1F6S3_9TELE
MVHQEFETAGKKPGLQVWRVENMDLKPVPRELYGNFFTGDAYILLYTTKAPSYKAHSWIGSEATQDEIGAAVIFLTHTMSVKKMSHSPSWGTSSLKGGVASGFKHVVTNDASCKRLLHVKGRRIVRTTEVEFSWSSFNKDDSFIIDLGKCIYNWSGSESNYFERLKATQVANDIRDNERNGRAEVIQIREGSEPEEVIKVSYLFISDAAGSMKSTLVADKNPFKQTMLSQNDCFIVDNGVNEKLFVWKGIRLLTSILSTFSGYSPSVYSWSEDTLFKQFFSNWLEGDITGPHDTYTVGSIAKVEKKSFDVSKLYEDKDMAAQHRMPDDGSGKVQIWRVEGSEKVPVDKSTYGQFFGGDCYLLLYSYTAGQQKHIIYYWQGLTCSQDERAASALLTVNLDDSMGGVAEQVRVTQGKEPPHFVAIFKGQLVIHLGGTSRHGGESVPSSTLGRISPSLCASLAQVEPVATSLNTNDVFVLKSNETQYVWKGKGATEEEMPTAKYLTSLFGGNATDVEESEEIPDFWEALGGKKEYQTSKTLQKNDDRAPRLFACSNKTGNLIAEEVPGEITQFDLATDDVMILDIWDQIFVWIGKDANKTEKSGSPKIADDYVDADPSGRRGIPISIIKQGEEPPSFTGWFHPWDPNMWKEGS